MRLLIPAALAALCAAPAWAQAPAPISQARTVSDLAAVCDPAWGGVPRLEAIAYCQGFLTAAGQYHTLAHPQGGRSRPLYCVPTPGPTVAEGGLAFANWARNNPTHANEPAMDGLMRWAQSAFPCEATPRRATGGRS